jgi:hypothetical protein
MGGVIAAMMVSLGTAAAVVAVLARRNAPDGGWRLALQQAVHAVRERDLAPADEAVGAADDEVAGGVADLFAIDAPADDEPAYSEATAVQHAIERARQMVRH